MMCNNLLLHLPSINQPIRDLWRTTKTFLLIRTLIGKSSFRIKQVREWEEESRDDTKEDPLYDENGEPRDFHYYNIYSEKYINYLCSKLSDVDNFSIEADHDFSPDAFGEKNWPDREKPGDLTRTISGLQVNGYVLQPWTFIKIWRKVK